MFLFHILFCLEKWVFPALFFSQHSYFWGLTNEFCGVFRLLQLLEMSRKRRKFMHLLTFFRWILPGLLSLLCSLKRCIISAMIHVESVLCSELHWLPWLCLHDYRLRPLFLRYGIPVAWTGLVHSSKVARELESWICLIGSEQCLGSRHVFCFQIKPE